MNCPLLSIDPGAHSTAYAFFDGDVLQTCGLLRSRNVKDLIDKTEALIEDLIDLDDPETKLGLVIEKPQVYRGRGENPNDLISVAISVGTTIGVVSRLLNDNQLKVHIVLPREWKGQRPKSIDNEYTKTLLGDDEMDALVNCGAPKSLQHNVVDAIGIGLWRLRRR